MAFSAGQVLTAAALNDLSITTLTTTGTVTVGAFTLPATDGTADQVLVTNGAGTVTWQDASGGAPGGSDGYIQYNNGGAFGGESALYWDDVNNRLGVGTTTPEKDVHVLGSNARMRVEASAGTNAELELGVTGGVRWSAYNNNTNSRFTWYNTTSGNVASLTTDGDLDIIGQLSTEGPDGGGVIRYWTASTGYTMFGTNNMAGQEYAVLTDGTSTFIGCGSGGATYIRGPANDTNPQIINDGSSITNEGNLNVTGYMYGYSTVWAMTQQTYGVFFNGQQNALGSSLFYVGATALRVPAYVGTALTSSTNSDYYSYSDSSYGGYGGVYHFKADTSISGSSVGNAAVTSGRFYASNTSVGSTSDARLKSDIADLDQGVALAIINRLRPRTFVWDKEDWTGLQPTGTQIGFIAQEVDEVFPAWVDYWPEEQVVRASDGEVIDRPLAFGLDYQFDAMVVAAIQNIVSRVEALEQA